MAFVHALMDRISPTGLGVLFALALDIREAEAAVLALLG